MRQMQAGMAQARAQYVMRDESHRKFLPPINPKVKTMHVKEQQKQNMFICNYFSKYKITDTDQSEADIHIQQHLPPHVLLFLFFFFYM